ncbi:hypothetical protein MTO96_016590 [Rhipicephalus appendiculatus]
MSDDDDDDSGDDDKSTASSSSSMSTASTGGKGQAAKGGGSGLGLCLCLLGVLGLCAAGAVAAFLLLDEGGAGNKTDNATEAATQEDAPQLDAYGRFAQQQDKPLKAAVVARQRVRRNTTRRHSRVKAANGAVEKQSNHDQVSETHSKLTAAARHFPGDSRRASHKVKSVVKPRGRYPAAGEAGLRASAVRRISDEASQASGGSLANETARKRVVGRNSATRTAYTANASKNAAHVVVSTYKTPDASAGNRLNVSVRARVVEGQTATDAERRPTGRLKKASSRKP